MPMQGKPQNTPPVPNKASLPAQPAAPIWTSLDLINWTRDYFQKKGIESARLEAELLLASVLGCPRIRLYVDFEKAVAPEHLALYREKVKRRAETREPLQYIVGQTEFLHLSIKVTPAVLIPRPETELLAMWGEERLNEIAKAAQPDAAATEPDAAAAPRLKALDICTGSGCLALYLASKVPAAHIVASDISAAALAVASENAKALQLDSKVAFHAGDLFAALPPEHKGSFDLIVSNPPYVNPADKPTLAPEVLNHEPAQALFADEAGLAVLRRIVNEAAEWLRPGGWLGLEFGVDQAEILKEIAADKGLYDSAEIKLDHARRPRMFVARKRQ